MQKTAVIQKHSHFHKERHPYQVRFFHLVWLFLLCSFIGLVGETVVSFVLDGRWESRAGFVFGPLSPIYGCGAVLITVSVNPIRHRSYLQQFIVSGLLGGAFEYFAGWFFESHYGIVAWSYIDQPLNFHGHTSVLMCAIWGAIGVAWMAWGLGPSLNLIERIPQNVRKQLTNAVFCFILVDALLTLGALDCWFMRAAGMQPVSAYQQFFATWFDDAFMSSRFETMGMWTELAAR